MRDTVKKILAATKFDGLLLLSGVNRFWFTNFDSSMGYLLINKDASGIFLLDGRYYETAKKELNLEGLEVRLLETNKTVADQLNEALNSLKIKSLLVESEYTTLKDTLLLRNLEVDKLHSFESARLRIVKKDFEIEKLQKAADIAADTIEWIKKQIRPGMTEIQVANMITDHMLRLGASKNSFDPIVASGINSAFPHHHPTNKVINKLDIVTVDIGCIFEGYCSDITRTFILGNEREFKKANGSLELLNIYNTVLEAQLSGIKASKIGITGKELDAVCRDVISNTKYKDYFVHSTGHGVGIEVHELPNVSKFNLKPMEKNNVITIEPGIYIPQLGGVRIEDTIVIQDGEPLVLTKRANKNLFLGK